MTDGDEKGAAPPPGAAPPVDLDHLARHVFGDSNLERDVLRLMAEQAAELPDRIRRAEAGPELSALAHRLRGAARAVGAAALAEAAAAVEEAGDAADGRLERLEEAAAAVRRFIRTYLSR